MHDLEHFHLEDERGIRRDAIGHALLAVGLLQLLLEARVVRAEELLPVLLAGLDGVELLLPFTTDKEKIDAALAVA